MNCCATSTMSQGPDKRARFYMHGYQESHPSSRLGAAGPPEIAYIESRELLARTWGTARI